MTLANPAIYGARLTGTLTSTTAIVIVNNLKPISTLVFTSATAPTIELSLDGTTFYPAVTPTGSKAGQIYYILNYPVAAIKFTGAINDTYAVL